MASNPIQSLLQQLSSGQGSSASQPWAPPPHGDFERYAQQLVQDNNRALLQDLQRQTGNTDLGSWRWRLQQWAMQHNQGQQPARLPVPVTPPPAPAATTPPAAPRPVRRKSRMPSIMMSLVVLLIVLPDDLKPLPVVGFIAAMFISPIRNWLLQDQQP